MKEAEAMTENATVVQVESLLGHKTVEEKIEIASALGDRLTGNLNGLDQQVAEELARQLAAEAIERVRLTLSRSLRHNRFLPKDVAFSLAYDVENIAVPFLEVTEVFSDDDLCRIAKEVGQLARAAIARRPTVSRKVSDALVKFGDLSVAQTLVANSNADISDESYGAMIQRYETHTSLIDGIAMRSNLDAAVVAQLINHVSAKVRERLSDHYGLALDFVNPVVEDAHADALLRLIAETEREDIPSLVGGMKRRKELSGQFLLKAVQRGYLEFFTLALSELVGMSSQTLRQQLWKGGETNRGALYSRAGISSVLHLPMDRALKQLIQNERRAG